MPHCFMRSSSIPLIFPIRNRLEKTQMTIKILLHNEEIVEVFAEYSRHLMHVTQDIKMMNNVIVFII